MEYVVLFIPHRCMLVSFALSTKCMVILQVGHTAGQELEIPRLAWNFNRKQAWFASKIYLWKVIATCFSNINHVAKITCWGTTTLLSPNYPGKFAFSGTESPEITMHLHSLSLIILTHIYIESSSSPKSCKQNQQNKMTVLMELELWTNV